MKKVYAMVLVVVMVAMVVVLTGCPSMVGLEGIARFANTTDHEGIVVSLEAVEGAQTSVVSARVSARSITAQSLVDQTTTDAEGTYRFSDLEPGTYTVYASSNDSSERAVRTNVAVIEASTVTVEELLLTATGSISGTVVNGATGDGEMGWIVAVGATSYMAITGSDGSFEISDVPAGSDYPIIVMKGDHQFAGYYADVRAGATTDTGSYNVSLSGESAWHAASGAPGSDRGDVGDFYLDMDSGSMYRKAAGGWVLEGNLTGPAGDSGPAGSDGASIQWRGTATSHPSGPQLNWAYYNSADGISYIYDGTDWQIMTRDRSDGAAGPAGSDGADGADGVSIQWQGTATSHPSDPQLNCTSTTARTGRYSPATGLTDRPARRAPRGATVLTVQTACRSSGKGRRRATRVILRIDLRWRNARDRIRNDVIGG